MDDTADQQRHAMRDRLLALLVERSYQYRPEKPFTLSSAFTVRKQVKDRGMARWIEAAFVRATASPSSTIP